MKLKRDWSDKNFFLIPYRNLKLYKRRDMIVGKILEKVSYKTK